MQRLVKHLSTSNLLRQARFLSHSEVRMGVQQLRHRV